MNAADVVGAVTDPELPMITLTELGIVREVRQDGAGVVVTITPTFSGCPAMESIRTDIRRALGRAGFEAVEVRTVLAPAWTTDWISESGRRKLAAAGISPPGPAPQRGTGPIPLTLGVRPARVARPAEVARPADAGRSAGGARPPEVAWQAGIARPADVAWSADVAWWAGVVGPADVACPRCGAPETEQLAAFGATACRELRRCLACREPFEHMREI